MNRQLIERLADGELHSGQALADQFGVSRTAVWKQLKQLQAYGLTVESIRGSGYRLTRPVDLLDVNEISSLLSPAAQDRLSLEVHDELDSTSGHLLRAAETTPLACLAEYQSAGRGRRGRVWQAPFASGLLLSLRWQYPAMPDALSGLSLAVGVAVAKVLEAHGAAPRLKWPNDLVAVAESGEFAKFGGILIDLAGESQGPCVVVIGLGLNLQAAPDITDQAATCFAALTEQAWTRNQLAAEIISALVDVLQQFPQTGFAAWHEDWRRLDALQGRDVVVGGFPSATSGQAAGVARDGALLVQTSKGQQRIVAGDVSVRATPVSSAE